MAAVIDMVTIKSNPLNKARLVRGLGRMEFYKLAGMDPRTGSRVLNNGRVHIATAKRVATVLKVELSDILDLSEFEDAA